MTAVSIKEAKAKLSMSMRSGRRVGASQLLDLSM
jgi:hypothetical protein